MHLFRPLYSRSFCIALILITVLPLFAAGVRADQGRETGAGAYDNAWVLDTVTIGYDDPVNYLGVRQVSTGGTFREEFQGTVEAVGTMSGEMHFTYPERLASGEEASFFIEDAFAKFDWSFSPKYPSSSARIEVEFYDYNHTLYNDCEFDESNSVVGGSAGSVNLSLVDIECAFDDPDNYWDSFDDKLSFVFEFTITINHCDNWGCTGLGHQTARVQLNYEFVEPPTTTITGKVYVPQPDQPLIGVPVTVMRDGEVLSLTTSRPPDGRYTLYDVPVGDNTFLKVNLEHMVSHPSTFRIDYADRTIPVYAQHGPFAVADSPDPLVRDFKFVEQSNMETDARINVNHLDDLGTIYYHTHQAWQLADQLQQPLDFQLPVDIVAFSTTAETFWEGPMTNGLSRGEDPFINIEAASSTRAFQDRPDNREWHEFGHHVMADNDGNVLPGDTRGCPNPAVPGFSCNHYGYGNAMTTDSWVEGFAEFYSMMVAREIEGDPRPELYSVVNMENQNNAEGNYLAWTDEEFAVAGLLLDLVDPADQGDLSPSLGGDGYADCVAADFETEIWPALTKSWNGVVAGSPVTPTFGYIFNVKHLYDVLKHEGIGDEHSRGRADLDDLDELFVAHGFFFDDVTFDVYDAGEEVGRAAYPAAPNRRAHPAEPGSYIAYQAVDSETGTPIEVQSFDVKVDFAPPFDLYDYEYQAIPTQSGRLYFYGPDPQYDATIFFTAKAVGYVSTEPFRLENDAYWQRMSQGPDDHFIETTVQMEPQPAIFLPMIRRGGVVHNAVTGALSRLLPDSAPTRTPEPCTPINGGDPTPTPTITPTATTMVEPEPTVTPTPTPISTPNAGGFTGIHGTVTHDHFPANNVLLNLYQIDGASRQTVDTGFTDEEGNYDFAGLPSLASGGAYVVAYENAEGDSNQLFDWYGNQIEGYQAGDVVEGGDFDVANVALTAPADGAGVSLPAEFCWTPRSTASDNYVWMVYDPNGGQFAASDYLGYVNCFTLTGLPSGWPTEADYQWWVQVYQGNDPAATPLNYGDSYWARNVTIDQASNAVVNSAIAGDVQLIHNNLRALAPLKEER